MSIDGTNWDAGPSAQSKKKVGVTLTSTSPRWRRGNDSPSYWKMMGSSGCEETSSEVLSLFTFCARTISENVSRLEQGICGKRHETIIITAAPCPKPVQLLWCNVQVDFVLFFLWSEKHSNLNHNIKNKLVMRLVYKHCRHWRALPLLLSRWFKQESR